MYFYSFKKKVAKLLFEFHFVAIYHFLESPKIPLESPFLLEENSLVRDLVIQKSPESFLKRVLNVLSYNRLRLIEKKTVFPINNARVALGVKKTVLRIVM
jgi:hypothetical protein